MKYGKGIKCILLSLRAGVGIYFHSPLAWLVLTMIVRKQKLLCNCYEGLRKNTTLTIMHKNIFKKIPGGRLNLFCLRQVVDDLIDKKQIFLKVFFGYFQFHCNLL